MPKRSPRRRRPRPDAALMPPEALDAVSSRFRLLGSASRLRILDALMAGPQSIGALAEATGLTQSNLSRHVGALERGGCVRRVRDGQSVLVTVVDPTLKKLCTLVCGSLRDEAAAAHEAFAGL
jgi:DNA-binding transcriptional ArsR family regulator